MPFWDLVPLILKWNEVGTIFQNELLDYLQGNEDQESSMKELIWARKKNDYKPFQQAFSTVKQYLRERITQSKVRATWNGSLLAFDQLTDSRKGLNLTETAADNEEKITFPFFTLWIFGKHLEHQASPIFMQHRNDDKCKYADTWILEM